VTVEVLSPGMNTTVQDLGRYRFRAYGMPVAGALDRYSLMAGNLVAGNGPGAAALEYNLFSGPVSPFRIRQVWFASLAVTLHPASTAILSPAGREALSAKVTFCPFQVPVQGG